MVHTEKSVVVSAQIKQKLNAGLLAVQGGAFDIEPAKGKIQENYGKALANILSVISTYGNVGKWNASDSQKLLASINFKNSTLIATNTYKACSNLYALRDAFISANLTIITMAVTIAYELGGFDNINGVATIIIDISQNPISQFPALQTYFNDFNKFVEAISARDVNEANKQATALKSAGTTLFTALIPQLIARYQAVAGAPPAKADVGQFLGALVTYYKPQTDGNIDAFASLAATPVPSK